MARHSLFPNSITINYTSNGHSHKQVLPVGAVAGSSPAWTLPVRVGSPILWTDCVDTWADLLAAFLDTGASIDSADLYTYEATDAPAEFLATYSVGRPGDSVAAVQPWSQIVFPFKGLGGNSLRITIVEQVNPVDLRNSFGAEVDAALCALMEFVLGPDDFIITRGGGFPLASLGYTTKTNDKLRERYFLD